MNRHFFNFKQSIQNAPVFVIFIYYIFITLDLFTTWLASPDLTFEWNILVRVFHLGWISVIIVAICGALVLSLSYILSINYIKNQIIWDQYYSKPLHKNIFQAKHLLISFLVLGYFYMHLMYSAFVSANNYLGYIYINVNDHFLSDIVQDYIKLQIALASNFFIVAKIIFIFIAYTYTLLKFYKLKSRFSV